MSDVSLVITGTMHYIFFASWWWRPMKASALVYNKYIVLWQRLTPTSEIRTPAFESTHLHYVQIRLGLLRSKSAIEKESVEFGCHLQPCAAGFEGLCHLSTYWWWWMIHYLKFLCWSMEYTCNLSERTLSCFSIIIFFTSHTTNLLLRYYNCLIYHPLLPTYQFERGT